MELRARIAANIRAMADERGLSLNRLADFAGVSRPSFFKALQCRESMTVDRLAKIAGALDVDPGVLVRPSETATLDSPEVFGVAVDTGGGSRAGYVSNPKKKQGGARPRKK